MTFESATDYLLGTINETASRRNPLRLDRMQAFLRELGDPHLRYPTIHVGGTSGKGSTSTMIATALTASGKKTGLHTKPHLSSMTERARIDGTAISEDGFAELLGEMMPAIEATAREFERPSYYETLLALAFVFFARREVDVAVIEVGLGGRLDGTNLVQPEVSIITNVGLDHTEVLGNTVQEIAADKAGIAKRGVPLVSFATGAARAVIEEACSVAGAPFFGVAEHASIGTRPSEPYGQSFAVTTELGAYELSLPILGGFQQLNAATSIVALERLSPELRPAIADVERGFAQLETFPDRRFVFVVGIGESKDAPNVLEPFFGLPASFVFTQFETPGRTSARPQRLANIAERAGFLARTIGDPVDALAIARRSADGAHVVVVTGSTFVTGLLREWWLEHVVERSRR
jgi:dihydrofolate synthase/folylpolyglutamate synthase